MGLFDFFRRNKVEEKNYNEGDFKFTSDSGVECKVNFVKEINVKLEDGSEKTVQLAIVTYVECYDEEYGNFSGDSSYVVMDVEQLNDEKGNKIGGTKAYYMKQLEVNKDTVMKFFNRKQVEENETGYIGHIGKDLNTGQPNRAFDSKLRIHYKRNPFNKQSLESPDIREQLKSELAQPGEVTAYKPYNSHPNYDRNYR